MKRFNLHLDINSPNLVREFQTYSEKLDLDNKPTGILEDRNNHCIDAARYAIDQFTREFLPEVIRYT